MLKFRELPLLKKLESMEEKARAEALTAIVSTLFQGEAAELLAHFLQSIWGAALVRMGQPMTSEQIQRELGKMEAVNELRALLCSCLPENTQQAGVELMDGEIEEPHLTYPDSGFAIPYPRA